LNQPTYHLPSDGEVVGSYRVVRRLGAGGMGVVFEAINLDTDAPVALKWLSPELLGNPEAVRRFRVEAKATGRIRHPNVVAVHGVGEHHGQIFLVMELLRGRTLRARLNEGPLSAEEACQLLFPAMRGVAAAHQLGVLHRDLKPENIFLTESPDDEAIVPKVLDFGIAKLTADTNTQAASAHTSFMGTYQYMAFEQLHGRKDLDARVDVYAMGTVLYTALTGTLPYDADNPVDLALQMLQSSPVPITSHVPSLPEELASAVERALLRDRDQRYASIEAFAAALQPFSGGMRFRSTGRVPEARGPSASVGTPADSATTAPVTPPAVSPSPTPFVVRAKSRREPPTRRPLGLALSLALLAAGGGLWWWKYSTATATSQAKPPAKAPPPVGAQVIQEKTEERAAPLRASSDWVRAQELPPLEQPVQAARPSPQEQAAPLPTVAVDSSGTGAPKPKISTVPHALSSQQSKGEPTTPPHAAAQVPSLALGEAAKSDRDPNEGSGAPSPKGEGTFRFEDKALLPMPTWAKPRD
jgi:serine/threonine protein kinase